MGIDNMTIGYLQIAMNDIGIEEIPGQRNNPRILHAFEAIGHKWLNTDEHAWCGAMLGLWMKEAGLPFPKNAFRALSWAEWGEPCGCEYGAVALMTRKGGGHVGIVTCMTPDKKWVEVLGGNQGNMVKYAWFPVERITAYRKPIGAKLQHVPIAGIGEKSESEA